MVVNNTVRIEGLNENMEDGKSDWALVELKGMKPLELLDQF